MEGGFSITNVLTPIGEVFTWSIDLIMANPVMSIFFASGLVGVGIGVVKKLKATN